MREGKPRRREYAIYIAGKRRRGASFPTFPDTQPVMLGPASDRISRKTPFVAQIAYEAMIVALRVSSL